MRVNFSLEEITGKKPKFVARLLRSRGINPYRPYRALVTFTGVIIEQDEVA